MPSLRFGESYAWRYIVTDLDSVTLSILGRYVSNRTVTTTLNAPSLITGSGPSDNGEIAGLYAADNLPFLNEGNRLIYAFRRENDGTDTPWQIRAAGIPLYVKDTGGPNAPTTEFKAWDPWQLMYRRPVTDYNGYLPCASGEDDCQGITYLASRGSDILLELLSFTEAFDGETHIDFSSSWWDGTVENTVVLDEFELQQGQSIGEAMDALVETGTMDIILTPIYDPANRPGKTHELSVYASAGTARYDAVFAWDKPGRSIVEITAEYDGNERANNVQFYAGQGGPPVPLQSDAGSITTYGNYWLQQFFPGQVYADAVESMALSQLRLREDGLRTFTMSPAPERSPIPFVDYDLGDTVPVYASARLREEIGTMLRVQSIPLVIGDDQLEAGQAILLSTVLA